MNNRTNLFARGKMVALHSYYPQIVHAASMPVIELNPCKKNGFNPESMLCAAVSKDIKYAFEAKLFAAFLSTETVQQILAEAFPSWTPINKKVLNSTGNIIDQTLDLRSYYSMFSRKIFYQLGPMINVLLARYCLKLQSLDEVMETLRANCH
jgi:hypothetical protein